MDEPVDQSLHGGRKPSNTGDRMHLIKWHRSMLYTVLIHNFRYNISNAEKVIREGEDTTERCMRNNTYLQRNSHLKQRMKAVVAVRILDHVYFLPYYYFQYYQLPHTMNECARSE